MIPAAIGELARQAQPRIIQAFVKAQKSASTPEEFERKLYLIRRITENHVLAPKLRHKDDFYITSCSAKTINYKGLGAGAADRRFHYN